MVRILATERSMSERPNTIAGLVEKRAEIGGRIAQARATLRQLIIDLDHVDAAIRLFDPNYDVVGIKPKSYPAGHVTYRGELVKIVLDLLREAPGPMTTREVGVHIMVERGLNTADDMIVKTYTRRAGALLRHYRERGSVRSIKDPRGGQFDLWEVARLQPAVTRQET
jgi:hypothetical protein